MFRLPLQNPWRGLKGLPADVWILFGTTLVNRMGTMVLPFLAVYLAQHLQYSARVAGFALTAYGAGTLTVSPVAGRLSDRFGGLRVMQVSLLSAGILLLIVPLATKPVAVFAVIFIWAMAAEAVRPASLTTLTGIARPEQRKAAVALNRLAINLGMSVGPAVGGLLAAISFPMLFVVDAATSLAAGLFLSVMISRRSGAEVTHRDAREPGGSGLFRDRQMWVFLAGVFLCYVVFLQLDAALPLYLVRDLNLPVSFFGLLFVLNTVLIVLIEVPLNLAMSSWTHRHALTFGALLLSIGFGGFVFTSGPFSVAAMVVIWTFGEMVFLPTAATYAGEVAPPGRRGEYVGAYSTTFGVALMLGPWLGTVVLDHFGAVTLWSAVCGLGMVAAGVVWVATGPRA